MKVSIDKEKGILYVGERELSFFREKGNLSSEAIKLLIQDDEGNAELDFEVEDMPTGADLVVVFRRDNPAITCKFNDSIKLVFFGVMPYKGRQCFYVNFSKMINPDRWSLPWDEYSFMKAFFYNLKENPLLELELEGQSHRLENKLPPLFNSFKAYLTNSRGVKMLNAVKWFVDMFDATLMQTHRQLITELAKANFDTILNEGLISRFNFPKEIKTACQQYLLYFAEFLKDIGIEVTNSITEEEGKTLFTVTPADKDEALSKIKEALDIYLAIPHQPGLEVAASEFLDPGVQQLMANIHHLKGQLMLHQSIIQAKEATIQTLQLTNYQMTQIIEAYKGETKNEEKVFGGLVKVQEVEGKGFTLNLPEIFRRMKRRLGK